MSQPTADDAKELEFCTIMMPDFTAASDVLGACCTADDESDVKRLLYDSKKLSDACKPLQAQYACGKCHPFAAHLALPDGSGILDMCSGWCGKYFNACKADLDLPDNFCANAGDGYYCYPDGVNATRPGDGYYCYPDGANAAAKAPPPSTSTKLPPYFKKLSGGQIPSHLVGLHIVPGSKNKKWWMLNQDGKIVEVDNDPEAEDTTTVLDATDRVNSGGGEVGLLGLAFSPDFTKTGYFYVNYVDDDEPLPNTVVARYTYVEGDKQATHDSEVKGDKQATHDSEVKLLTFQQPFLNHNAGQLLFSPADKAKPDNQPYYDLFIATGDGGSFSDPDGNAQNKGSLLGKILRIRLSTDPKAKGYTLPPDNIKVKKDGKEQLTEAYAYGLRNPWRCSFDSKSLDKLDLWCADVGQDRIERIVRVKAGGNYGWRKYEGTRDNIPDDDAFNFTPPVYQYCHQGEAGEDDDPICKDKPFTGECITGGFVYRGAKQSDVYGGQYIFADWQAHRLLRLIRQPDGGWRGDAHRLLRLIRQRDGGWRGDVIVDELGWTVSSLAEDDDGELYVLRYDSSGSAANVYALPSTDVAAAAATSKSAAQTPQYKPSTGNMIAPGAPPTPPPPVAGGTGVVPPSIQSTQPPTGDAPVVAGTVPPAAGGGGGFVLPQLANAAPVDNNPVSTVGRPVLVPGAFTGASTVSPNDIIGLELTGNRGRVTGIIGAMDPGDSVVYTFDVTESGTFPVVFNRAPCVASIVPDGPGSLNFDAASPAPPAPCPAARGRVPCAAGTIPDGPGSLNFDAFYTNNEEGAFRARDVTLVAGRAQPYTLCFARGAYADFRSTCIGFQCKYDQDLRPAADKGGDAPLVSAATGTGGVQEAVAAAAAAAQPAVMAAAGEAVALPATFKAGAVVNAATDLRGVEVDAKDQSLGYIDDGDSVVYTFDVAEPGTYAVVYGVYGKPPTKQPLSFSLHEGRVPCTATAAAPEGGGAMHVAAFYTNNNVLNYRANDIALAEGKGQEYTLCFVQGQFVNHVSTCIGADCRFEVDARVPAASGKRDLAGSESTLSTVAVTVSADGSSNTSVLCTGRRCGGANGSAPQRKGQLRASRANARDAQI
ncbi:Sorbosone dehydrogenase-domain-containing protein [Tribonema minus]|uniref:Sorbosone dehydrogenase-domain-containing protein n=1 Tax=Tribonema minus TaxID=303371 RepID=A0A835YJB6_9STRA|nr:Sorbosone dehydrogenase-domain-containing protein [Tribonema minus]